MHPIFITVGSRTIYWYGVMVALGFVAAILVWGHYAKREGFPAGTGSDLGFWLMVSSILGARAAYVISSWPYYQAHPADILRIDKGGVIFYGGLIGGIIGVIACARFKRTSIWKMGDIAIMGLPLGHVFGRVGCFMNGCCYGTPTRLPWGVHLYDAIRHPTQLYESALNLVIFFVLCRYYPRRRRYGEAVALYLLLYPTVRFFDEFLRGDPRQTWLGLHDAQVISLLLFMTGLVLWKVLPRHAPIEEN